MKMTAERRAVIDRTVTAFGWPQLASSNAEAPRLPIDLQRQMMVMMTAMPLMSLAASQSTRPENDGYRAEYAQLRAAYEQAGMSEAEYVQSRRIDDGLDTLAPVG